MFDKFYVQVSSRLANNAAKLFISHADELSTTMDYPTMRKLLNFCEECIILHENRVEDHFNMTNTQAVWVYSWCNEIKVARLLAEHRKAEHRTTN